MAHCAIVIADTVLEDAHRRIYADIRDRLLAQVQGLKVDEVSSPAWLGAKMWLPHSKSAGFATDEASGSRLAFIGNPTGGSAGRAGQGEIAGKVLGEYLRRGREAVMDFNAPFACVIFNGRDGTTHVITDRLGLQRVYAARVPGAWALATSSLALAAAVGARLDVDSVLTYFRAGHLLGEQTFFREVRKIGAARQVTFLGDEVKEEEYWKAPDERRWQGLDGWKDTIVERAVGALDEALAGGATTVELTGGLDTRMNFAAALATKEPFAAWTITDVSAKDTQIAKRLSMMSGVEHITVSPLGDLGETFEEDFRLLHILTDGELDCLNVIASPSANRQTAGRRVQSVTGVGGELLRGFYYRSIGFLSDEVSVGRLVNWQLCLGTRYDASIFRDEFADRDGERLATVVRGILGTPGGKGAQRQLDEFYLRGSLQAAGGRSMTFNNFFYRQAAPLCSNGMLDAAFSMPAEFKKSGLALRCAVESAGGGLADVPLTTGLPARALRARDAKAIVASYAAYAQRAARKVASKLKLSAEAANREGPLLTIVREKLSEMCRRELIDGELASEALYKKDALREFLKRNVEEGLPDRTQVGLILSMELTARYLGGVRV